ncbi:MAG: hypothetical protein ABWY07_08345 [Burkholderiales bacterium]
MDRTRPLCPYPRVARYDGRGNINDAASFRCRKDDHYGNEDDGGDDEE